MEEVLYERLTPSRFEARLKKSPIAYLPLGTLEWHGAHLPLGSDFLQSQGFFIRLAQRVGGIVLPPLFVGPDKAQEVDGFEYYGMDMRAWAPNPPQRLVGSSYWVSYELFSAILGALLKQLCRVGFKIIVAHGHGPSTKYVIEHSKELSRKFGVYIFSVWQADTEREPDIGFQCDHAAMNETSIMMALHPNLVHMRNLPKNPKKCPLGILGKDPRIYASAEQGEKIIQFHLDRMEKILRDQLSRLST